jgi:FKBP-type peptidyl-prolyl cis-trans isomerase FkpA
MNKFLKLVLCLLVLSSGVSCKKKNVIDQATADENIITKYIAEHGLNATATGSGLYYVISSQGTGANPTASSVVTVNYKGYLTDGTVFDRSPTGGYVTALNKVIQGWQEGIPLFKKGGKGMLLIPSALGYGSQATGSIPANSVLIFDIELVDVN